MMGLDNKQVKSIRIQKPFWGLGLLLVGLFMLLSLIDYDPLHSQFYTTNVQNPWQSRGNRLGYCGIYFTFYTYRWLGLAAWLLPIYLIWTGLLYFVGHGEKCSKWKFLSLLLACFFTCNVCAFFEALNHWEAHYQLFSAGAGGLLGWYGFHYFFSHFLGEFGCALILIPCALLSILLTFISPKRSIQWFFRSFQSFLYTLKNLFTGGMKNSLKVLKNICRGFFGKIKSFFKRKEPSSNDLATSKTPINTNKRSIPFDNRMHDPLQAPIEEEPLPNSTSLTTNNSIDNQEIDNNPDEAPTSQTSNDKVPNFKVLQSEVIEKSNQQMPIQSGTYRFPPIDLLKEPPPTINDGTNNEDYMETAQDLVQKLAEFGVEVKVEAIQSGPVITRYEVTPARGVRVEKITTLDKNIALGLKALSVRIQAPVPGKGCVGIEIPNKFPLPVCLREILESKAWAQSDAEIPIVLGKEVTGRPIVADLTKMPHLLIAGATGSGKTVCINTIVASLLFHASPKDLKFIMVDPKIVEMKLYNDLPHMLIPVVTEPKRVPTALKWLIGEMERRYQLFANHGARNIATFNEKIKKMTLETLEQEGLYHLPYIVCIIDELADLMMVAPGDIETCIARLAQLARAAGIHLIIATQRPSVNVITGIIKANLPSRIAFKVASKVDSRTILDVGGADTLIGKGDMLFVPPGASQLIRAQGAWVSDEEINAMVDFLKQNGPPIFAEEVQRILNADEGSDEEAAVINGDNDGDDLIPQALEVFRSANRISTSLLQRRLKIGYNRAARIMETLESRGLVPNNGNSES